MTILTMDQLNIPQMMLKFEDSYLQPGGYHRDIVDLILIESKDDTLLEYEYTHGKVTRPNDKYRFELNEVFKKAGLHDLNFEFSPNNILNLKTNNGSYVLKDGSDFLKKIESHMDYEGWFQKIFVCFPHSLLIPDTNFLLNCYYSNYFKNTVEKNKSRVIFVLSRLTLLEVERILNEQSKSIKSSERKLVNDEIREENLESVKKSLEENKRQMRLGFQAIGEIGEMIKDGASIMPYNENLLKLFPQASGVSFADSWIRMEIDDYAKEVRRQGNDIIFLTSDLLNSLMSVAENMNTLYIYNTKKIKDRNKDIAKLIYSTCVFFEECSITIKSNQTTSEIKFKLRSAWNGKSTEEWVNRKVDYIPL